MRLTSLYQVLVVLLIFKINRIYSIGALYTTTENKHFFVNDEQKFTWFDGLRECLIRNMTLATIETDTKSHEINTLIRNNFGKNVILWVGGFMSHFPLQSRRYIWITTGETFNYVYWHGKNPDFYNNQEYCVQIGWGANMEWNDNNCANKFGFICQEGININDHHTSIEKKLEELQQTLLMEIKDRQNLQQKLNEQKKVEQHFKEQLEQIKQTPQKQSENELQPEEENKKYRNIIFHFYQNTHFSSK